MHYARWVRRGTTDDLPTFTPEERFWAKVERRGDDDCWLWTAATNGVGYGKFHRGGPKTDLAFSHRYAYELLVGPIPAGLVLDHLCRVRNCVNPRHLEPVTHGVNLRRGETLQASEIARTHCPSGHPYDDVNTYRWRGQRHCRICRRRRDVEYRARSRG